MTDAIVERGKIDIGRVIQQLFGVLGRNFATFFVLALLLVGLPNLLVGLSVRGGDAVGPGAAFGGLVGLITSAILQGTLIYGTVEDLNGRRASVGDSLATGLRAFLPLIAVSILMGLGLAVGFLLLVIPGLILLCIWAVAVPALVAERTDIFGAFSRSAELTRGNRWRIFALALIWLCAMLVISMAVSVVFSVGAVFDAGGGLNLFALAFSAAWTSLYTLVAATGVAVLYVELRAARDGVGPRALADIFS